MERKHQIATLLPADAREALIVASKVEGETARRIAIEAATEWAQRKYPHLFKAVPTQEPQP